MAFDQSTRNRLARFVGDCRALLSEEFTRQMQSIYGLDPSNGDIADIDSLTLSSTQYETARLLRETLEHYLAGLGKTDKKARQEVITRIVREQAFTVLNRLCAVRMAESRGLVIQCIGKGYQSKAFQVYKQLVRTSLGEMGDAYRVFLFSVFDEFAVDLPVLFDRFSPQGRLFPRETALLAVLSEINHADIDPLWAEDETIGWIYQYFNSVEERRQMRSESQAPRNSRELAVRNQFFTPRYVVEFLTDNTLGRIWYEMTQGATALKDSCRYLVRRPNEIFLAEGEEAPEQEEPAEDLSQEELLKQPVHIPHRPLKDPRDIKMLDPACGSMHFGLYAFDLFERIYDEAWDLEAERGADTIFRPEGLKPLHETYDNKDAFRRDVPRLIIERNIHGIDIDPRAVQIAGLSLWLRAQKTWQVQGVAAGDRPQIQRSNIVCAEPMPGEADMLEEFLKGLRDDRLESLIRRVLDVPENQQVRATARMAEALCDLVRTVWKEMELAGEAGSLLKIEDSLAEAIATGKEEWVEKAPLFRVMEFGLTEDTQANPKVKYYKSVPGEEEDFWNRSEAMVLAALEDYATHTQGSHAARRRLFALDAARGFAFIDICRRRFDAVLMNPPFGDCAIGTRQYVARTYPAGSNDICAAFVLSFLSRLTEQGRLGAITTRLALFIQTFAAWRGEILSSNHISDVADLGYGVLDAMVETAMYVIGEGRRSFDFPAAFVGLLGTTQKDDALTASLLSGNPPIEWRPASVFENVPGQPLAYWVPASILSRFGRRASFNSSSGAIRQGIATADDFRFLRLRWEVPQVHASPSEEEPLGDRWVPLAKGGEYSPWWDDIHLVLNWTKNGHEIRNFYDGRGKLRSRPQNLDSFFLEGATYAYRTTSAFGLRYMPPGCAFSVGGWGVFPPPDRTLAEVLAVYNTRYARYLMEVLLGQGDASVSGTAARNHGAEAVGGIPWPEQSVSMNGQKAAMQLVELWAAMVVDETCEQFLAPRNLTCQISSFDELVRDRWKYDCQLWSEIADRYSIVEQAVSHSYGFTTSEVAAITDSEGESLASLPTKDIDARDLVSLMTSSVEQLVDVARNALGAKRYVVKKAFFVDRAVDLACHIHGCDPHSVIAAATACDPYEVGVDVRVARELVSWLMGVVLGRWDARAMTHDVVTPPRITGTFYSMPPGLFGSPFLSKLFGSRTVVQGVWASNGICDSDDSSKSGIANGMRDAMERCWGNRSSDLEHTVAQALGVSSISEYLSVPNNFFASHLSQYSKSRRAGPIYWPLSTTSGSYTLWLYYHRLTDQTLYTCVNDFVDPKLKQVSEEASRLRSKNNRSSAEENVTVHTNCRVAAC